MQRLYPDCFLESLKPVFNQPRLDGRERYSQFAVREDATFQIFAKRLFDVDLWRVVISLFV